MMRTGQRSAVMVFMLVAGLGVCAAGIAAQATPIPAAPVAQATQSATAQGELVDVDAKANTLTVKTATGEMKFAYNEQTKVTGAQKGVAGLATMAGAQVTVQYHKEGANNIATSIDVRSAGAPRQ